jgi:acetoin utilization protein AcuB
MFVGLRMSRNVPVCAPDDGLDKAIQVMRDRKVRQLVVAEGDQVVGVLSRIDLQHVLPSTATTLSVNEMNYQLSRLKVRDYMTHKVVSVAPDTTIEEAARAMHDSDVSGLPVLKNGRLVGLINRTMMLEVFIEEMGLQVASSRITLELDDTPGQVLNVAQIIRDRGLNIVSIATFFHGPTDKRLVVFRVKTGDPAPIEEALRAAGYRIVTAADLGL